ncbi:MAG TPA: malto-oligosyltrehalose synthase [Vicinamibacteria bacterium]|nr:malto-oligosyltrehalose synthase [Vicinamibacteria bacterium]
MSADRRLPRATYRLQLGPELGFDDVVTVIPYLKQLGVSHVYLSPYLQAAPGSTHGYDVVDHGRVNEELGGAAAHSRMCEALRHHDLGQVIDVVPNHMSIRSPKHNPWWWDVLENGPSSLYAHCFDVDWSHPDDRMRNRVLVPILGDQYGRVLGNGVIRLKRSGAVFTFSVYDHVLPVAPISLAGPLGRAAVRCKSEDLSFAADVLRALPAPTVTDRELRRRRHRDKAAIIRFLAQLFEQNPQVARAVDEQLDQVNGNVDELHDSLERQNYRLAYWRSAAHDLDYRRFFDINELVALRMEDRSVFEATHRLVLGWTREGIVNGLRIDHPDGLRDPEQYLERLRRSAPRAWIVVEKILEPGEVLPPSWPVDGTTGYDFLNCLGGLFVDPDGEEPLTSLYREFVGDDPGDFDDLIRRKKRLVLTDLLASDVMRLTHLLVRVCETHLDQRDYTRAELRQAIEEVLIWLPVYRTYVRPDREPTEWDREILSTTIRLAREACLDLDERLFDFLLELLVGRHSGAAELEWVYRLQQLSGPAMAKGLEDTALYCFHRLVCLNEVGGHPGRFGTTIHQFHDHCARIQEQWPATMTATSTHDTKRSEDVRTRIALLSEIPERWREVVGRWAEHNRCHREGDGWPDRAMEYLVYQTLVGAWPIGEERLVGYLNKAAREAKIHTSWTRPHAAYEEALSAFASRLVNDSAFAEDVEAFVTPLKRPARAHSLAQALIKLCAPGVPDIYQGNELWEHSLTDPDNRRSVDFARRRELLHELESLSVKAILAREEEGLPKLWVTHRALRLRAARRASFGAKGVYRALDASGKHRHRVVAFARGADVIVVAPRLLLGLGGHWADTTLELPRASWTNVLSGRQGLSGTIAMSELFAEFPVALLEREE